MNKELEELVNISREIINTSVRGIFGEEVAKKAEGLLNILKYDIDEEKNEIAAAYYRPKQEEGQTNIFFVRESFESQKGKIEGIATMIHEIGHAFSYSLSEGEIDSPVEEAFTNIFSEMCINYYIQQDGKIPYISQAKYEDLKRYGFSKNNSYQQEGDFVRGLIYPIKQQGKDFDAIREYFFGNKEKFRKICIDVFGRDILDIMKQTSEGPQSVTYQSKFFNRQSSYRLIDLLDTFTIPREDSRIEHDEKRRIL